MKQKIPTLFKFFFELNLYMVYNHFKHTVANQKSVRYSVSKSHFTNIEFRNVNNRAVQNIQFSRTTMPVKIFSASNEIANKK